MKTYLRPGIRCWLIENSISISNLSTESGVSRETIYSWLAGEKISTETGGKFLTGLSTLIGRKIPFETIFENKIKIT